MKGTLLMNVALARVRFVTFTATRHISLLKMPSSWNYSNARPDSDRVLRSSKSRSNDPAEGLSQAGTQWTNTTKNTATDTIRTRWDLGTVDTKASEWRCGMIVQFPHILPTLDPDEKDPKLCVPTDNIGNVCPKIRMGIIVQVYEEKMIVLPVYSCHNRGLKRKSDHYRLLAMSVVADQDVDRSLDLTDEYLTLPKLQVSNTRNRKQWIPTAGSHINLNEPTTCKYAWPLVHCGSLDETSAGLLHRRYKMALHMGYLDLTTQHEHFKNQRFQDQARVKLQNAPPKLGRIVDEEGYETVATKKTKR